MNTGVNCVKRNLLRGTACLMAVVMMLSCLGVPGVRASADEGLPGEETPVVSNIREESSDSQPIGDTPTGSVELSESTAPENETETPAEGKEAGNPVKGEGDSDSLSDEEALVEINEEDEIVAATALNATYEDEAGWLDGSNWMSAISDFRRLNEINIPGTHDSGCASVWASHTYSGWFEDSAITQNLTIARQLEAGVRLLDLRWTNCISHISNADSDSLYENHGAYRGPNLDLLYYCTENGYVRSFEGVMDDIRDFLYAHPTETIILNMQSEYDDVKRYRSALDRDMELIYKDNYPYYLEEAAHLFNETVETKKRLLRESKSPYVMTESQIETIALVEADAEIRNYIYRHNYGVFATMKPKLEEYSDIVYRGSTVPALGEVRGKVVLLVKEGTDILGYGIPVNCKNQVGKFSAGGVDFVYQNCWDQERYGKSMTEYEFLDNYSTRLPEAGEHTNVGYINYSSSSKVPGGDKPSDIAPYVNAVLYMSPDTPQEEFWAYKMMNNPLNPWGMTLKVMQTQYPNVGEYGLFSERGRHFGWVYSDFVTEEMASMLWHTNFPKGVKSVTITYMSEGEVADTQKVTLGAEFEIPEDDGLIRAPKTGYGITGWKDPETGKIYKPGDAAAFEKDTVLEAQWEMTWSTLAAAIDNLLYYKPITITLDTDLVAEDEDGEIVIVPKEDLFNKKLRADVTIDLNGHTLDANAGDGGKMRRIFRVPQYSTLKIIDSAGTGTLTGGLEEQGGAILVEKGGSLALENVHVSGNHAKDRGGAVCAEAGTNVSVTLRNADITGNTAGTAGAGVYAAAHSELKLEGNVQIHGNTLKGASEPSSEVPESNLCLDNSLSYNLSTGPIIVSGPLDPESEIGVSLFRGPDLFVGQVITRSLSGNGSVNSFRSDQNRYEVLNVKGEAVFLGRLQTVNYDPNGATSGSVPLDTKTYDIGDTATVLDNTGNLLRLGYGFGGWNTRADGSGTTYKAGDPIEIQGSATLYAQWVAASVTTKENVTTIYGEFKDAVDAWVNGSTLTLLGDVMTDEILYVRAQSLTLDLNGYGITRVPNENGTTGMILFVYDGKELTLQDSAPDRTRTGENRPAGVKGGYLTGGHADGNGTGGLGGAVHVQGTLNMSGGTITGNQAAFDGGGVYVLGAFLMTGGAVTGNCLSYGLGGGVYVGKNAEFTLGGSARIADNSNVNGTSNVYLQIGSVITVEGLAGNAPIGVMMENPGVFTAGAAFADDMAAQAVFTSDSNAYAVQRTDDGQATLWKKSAIQYIDHKADGSPVAARCNGYTLMTTGEHEEAITLSDGWYAVMGDVTADERITVSGTVNLILLDGAKLNALWGITVGSDDTLNIYPGSLGDSVEGTGVLLAASEKGKIKCAGIGGQGTGGGSVAIHGCTVTATGGVTAAGIGGAGGSVGTVTIYDGTVRARGGEHGAGIGGAYGDGGTVTIYGGTVDAWGGRYGAGIGGANGSGGTVTVYNGMVTATGGAYAAGIGGGIDYDGGTVAVYGGTVKTAGGEYSDDPGEGIGRGVGGTERRSSGALTLGEGMYLYGAGTPDPESDTINNHIGPEDGDYVRTQYMTVNSILPHTHSLVYSAEGATLTVRCTEEGCALHDNPSSLTLLAPDEEELVYDGTAKRVGIVVDGRYDLWDNVTFTCEKQNPETGEWEELPKTIIPAESEEEEDRIIRSEATDAGTYRSAASFQPEGSDLIKAALEYTIRPRTVTVTAVDQTVLSVDQISQAYSRIRTGEGELLEGHQVLGFTLTPSPDAAGMTEGAIIPSAVLIYEGATDVTANYAITYVNGKFYVREYPASVTAVPTAVENLVYNGSALQLVTAGTADGGTMQYALGTENEAPLDGWSEEPPTAFDAGTYHVWYMAVGDTDHTDTEPAGPVKVEIGKRTAELEWDNVAFPYDGNVQAPTATVSNLLSTTEWADSCDVIVGVEGEPVNAGTYTARALKLSNDNYALPEENTLTFTIEKAAGEIRFVEEAVSKEYGAEPFINKLTNTGDGTVSYTSVDSSVATVNSDGQVRIVGIGTTTVTAEVEDSDNTSYEFRTASYTLTVSKKAAAIRFALTSANRPYGSVPFVNRLTNTGDGQVRFASGNPDVATIDVATGQVTPVGVGETNIMATVQDGNTSTYAEKTASYKLTVRKADNPALISKGAAVTMGGASVSLADRVSGAEGEVSFTIEGDPKGCTVDPSTGIFTSGSEIGDVTVTVTVAGNQNYIRKIGYITVTIVSSVIDTPDFTLPRGIASIDAEAFEGAAMRVAFIPDGCSEIGDYAFKDCTRLEQIRIPASVTEIGADIFSGCSSVFVYGTRGSAAEAYCTDNTNCVFIEAD